MSLKRDKQLNDSREGRVLLLINSMGTGGAERLLVDMLIHTEAVPGLSMDLALLNGSEFPFLQKLKASGYSGKIWELGHGSVYNPLLIPNVAKVLKQYDLVHVHLFPSLYWAALAKQLYRLKTRMVFTEHSTRNRRRYWLFRPLERWIYHRYDRIICISAEVRSLLSQHLGVGYERIEVINNGVCLDHFTTASQLDRSDYVAPDSFLIVQVSRFSYQKDQSTLIKAIPHLRNRAQVLFVGDGGLRGRCEALVRRLGLESRIRFLGIRSDVPDLLGLADVVVLSSRFEGLSLSGLEAMATGKPVVASNVPGLSVLVGGAGILFPMGDHLALAESLDQLFDRQDLREGYGAKGLARVQHFTIERMIADHVKFYQGL